MGGDVVGKTIEMPNYPGIIITIKGVFEAIPENANYRYDIAISMVSTSHFMWDGTNNWMGNDRYYTCVKLEKGVDTDGLAPAIRQMQIKYQDIEVLSDKYGVELYYILKPIRKVNGATAGDVMKIFVKDIVGLTFPCLIAGLAVARLLAGK